MHSGQHNAEEFRKHCQHFFDFREVMSAQELDYLHYCFSAVDADEAPISSKTYSHRITDHINSSRIGYGFRTLTKEHRARLAKLFLEKIGTTYEQQLSQADGAGAAWDIEQDHFKIYFYYKEYYGSKIPKNIEQAYCKLGSERIISYTFHENQCIEKKYYYYPKQHQWEQLLQSFGDVINNQLSEHSKRLAFVVSETKKPRFQWDVQENSTPAILNILKNTMVDDLSMQCKALGQQLDTVYSGDSIQLYFD